MVIAVGRVRDPVRAAVVEYEGRAARYWRIETTEVEAGVRGSASASPEQVRSAEGTRILARIPESAEVVALTRGGEALDSPALARYLEERAVRSVPAVAFAIGGAFGLGAEVLGRARLKLSLSPLTLPHEVARLVLAEQLYRCGTILKGEPYHKG